MPDYRAHLDASIAFVNGGSLSVEGFRLDLPSADLDEAAIERLLVQHLGLTLVGSVDLRNLSIVEEAHRGSRDVPRAGERERRVVDLSHVIRAGLVTYPGLPEPTITPFLTREASKANYAPGTEFAMDVMTLIGNTGTYLDSPWHRYEGGTDLAGLELATLVDLRAEVFHVRDSTERGVPASVFFERDVRGAAVLIDTGWDRHFGTPAYAVDAPFLAPDAVDYLIGEGATLVGIDSLNIDDTRDTKERPAHTRLLAAGIHVVEHLTRLDELPPSGARFTAAPPAIEEFGTFPVRAYAIVG
ncbi:kynurenine formamidase [Leifsonia sp. AK011]|uniref:cyclase family protein n=1 Tax=Leifsonia sp. AK011 TaxID=2723075 RepID=UPI0015C7649A|nr:cyclase family protein [Leifsonia sp. AK011]NYF08861.1 kynurenine formamidase [Leifsonia sp. AK011]